MITFKHVLFFVLLAVAAAGAGANADQATDAATQEQMQGQFVAYPGWNKLTATPGTRYVLVAAEWCSPCQQLKNKLSKVVFPHGINVVVVDYDANKPDALKMLGEYRRISGQRATIPRLIRYTTDSTGKTSGVYWNSDKTSLEEFFGFK